MSWNYQRIKRTNKQTGETMIAMHEVYRNRDGSIWGWTENPVHPMGETEKVFRESMMIYRRDAERPLLDEDELIAKRVQRKND